MFSTMAGSLAYSASPPKRPQRSGPVSRAQGCTTEIVVARLQHRTQRLRTPRALLQPLQLVGPQATRPRTQRLTGFHRTAERYNLREAHPDSVFGLMNPWCGPPHASCVVTVVSLGKGG